jgi:hypothetical protein
MAGWQHQEKQVNWVALLGTGAVGCLRPVLRRSAKRILETSGNWPEPIRRASGITPLRNRI